MATKQVRRLAHEHGLGCGDTKELEIVGDVELAQENWHFVGPFKNMTFAARMQHLIYPGFPICGLRCCHLSESLADFKIEVRF